MMMQGSISDNAEQDQKRVVTRITIRNILPLLNIWIYSFKLMVLFYLFSMLWIKRRLNCGTFKLEKKKVINELVHNNFFNII